MGRYGGGKEELRNGLSRKIYLFNLFPDDTGDDFATERDQDDLAGEELNSG